MGRKIPAKKHRGVKDPLAQQAKRLRSIKGKINAPPKDPDEQPIPQSLIRLFSFQNAKPSGIKEKEKKMKQKNKPPNKTANGPHGNKMRHNPISRMQRLPGESGRSFSLRINGALRALNDCDEQLEYPKDEEVEDVKGSHMDEMRQRRERKRRRLLQQRAAREREHENEREPEHDMAEMSRVQRRALKLKAKKLKRIEREAGVPEVVYERVSFGEVVAAPPTLTFKSKKLASTDGTPRPGRRDLLLSKLLVPGPRADAGADAGAGAGAGAADARRRERARMDAVDAYRALKAAQRSNKKKS